MENEQPNSDSRYPQLKDMLGPTDEARVLQLEQWRLSDACTDAWHSKDEQQKATANAAYEANVQSLIALLGTDAHCNYVDMDLFSSFSDYYKSIHGIRPRFLISRAGVKEWFARQSKNSSPVEG